MFSISREVGAGRGAAGGAGREPEALIGYFASIMLILLILLTLVLFPHAAYAYIDPGAGSLLLQSLIAIAVGAWLAFRVFWSKFWRKLRGGRGVSDPGADEKPDPGDDGPTG